MTDQRVVVRSPHNPSYAGATDSTFLRHNSDVLWGGFDSEAYWEHNYRTLREEDDAQIIKIVANFFGRHFGHQGGQRLRAIDVGTGSNLYPALSLLPWSDRITLADYAESNISWLTTDPNGPKNLDGDDWSWEPFWDALCSHEDAYRGVKHPRRRLDKISEIERRSIMALKSGQEEPWDLGTMFFVAESMTSYEEEFEDATHNFLNALKPGAPFAAAFMDSSNGYVVADKSFPAVRQVDAARVKAVLDEAQTRYDVQKIDIDKDPLRDGYHGMIVAVGTTRGL